MYSAINFFKAPYSYAPPPLYILIKISLYFLKKKEIKIISQNTQHIRNIPLSLRYINVQHLNVQKSHTLLAC